MKKLISIVSFSLIFLCGIIFAGCNGPSGSFQLTFKDGSVQMLTTDEPTSYTVNVTNYQEGKTNLSFYFADNVASIVEGSVKHVKNGEVAFSIAPLTFGSTTLTISVVGSKDSINVPVVVHNKLTSVESKQGLFVKKGEPLKITDAFLNLYPQDTTMKSFKYKLKTADESLYFDESTNLLTVSSDSTLNTVEITAISSYDENVSTDIVLSVVNPVGFGNLKVNNKKALEYNEADVFELILNDKDLFKKEIDINYDDWDDYNIDIYGKNGILIDGIQSLTNKSQNFKFELSSENNTTGSFVVRLYQKEFPGNYKELTINVNAIYTPENIAINGSFGEQNVNIFTGYNTVKDFSISVFPTNIQEEIYNYRLSIWEGNTKVLASEVADNIQIFYNQKSITELKQIDEYYYMQNGTVFGEHKISIQSSSNVNNNIIKIKVECIEYKEVANPISENFWENTTVHCENIIEVTTLKGSKTFKLKDEFANGVLYLNYDPNNPTTSDTKIFEGIEIDENSSVGKLFISVNSSQTGYPVAELSQEIKGNSYTKNISIKPIAIGQTEFIISTEYEKTIYLNIIVFKKINSNDFSIKLENINTDVIAGFTYTESQPNTLETVTVKGIGGSINIIPQINNNAYINNFTYSYTITGNNIDISENLKRITTKSLGVIPVTVSVSIFTASNFKYEKTDVSRDFTINCVAFIKEIKLYANNSLTSDERNKAAEVYNKNDLSYAKQNLSKAYFYIEVIINDGVNDTSIKDISSFAGNVTWNFKTKNGQGSNFNNIVGDVGNFSTFETGENIAVFNCEYISSPSNKDFTAEITIKDVNTNKHHTSAVDVFIKNYIKVEEIWLTAPMEHIYLDASSTYRQLIIGVNLLPQNAMCKDIKVFVRENNNNNGCINYQINGQTIVLNYISSGSGKLYIFAVDGMKIDEFNESYNHLAIDFVCADGETEETALKLSTYQDLLKLTSNKHYYVDSEINCGGNELTIAEFSGTIRGTFHKESSSEFANDAQLGSIVNFSVPYVDTDNSNNIGLFRQIKSGAKLYNLLFSGLIGGVNKETVEIRIKNSNSAYVGILCGTNFGNISNVTVINQQQNNINIYHDVNTYFGLVAGKNEGTIEVSANAKDYTLLAKTLTNNTSDFTVDFYKYAETGTASANEDKGYFGGVTGTNSGTIKTELKNIFTVGLYGIHASIFAESNALQMSAVSAENSGEIKGLLDGTNIYSLKVVGELYNDNTKSTLAGIVAKNSEDSGATAVVGKINRVTSRVFLRGYNKVYGLTNTLDYSYSQNNKVQATDDGSRSGVDMSLIKLYSSSATYNALYYEYNSDTDTTNKAESYITRAYNGDIIFVETNNSLSSIPSDNRFELGEDDFDSSAVKSQIALACFKKAKQQEQQQYIDNKVSTIYILTQLGILANTNIEINIVVNTVHLASIKNYGMDLNMLNTGNVNLTLSSLLNYQKTANASVQVTNSFDMVKLYEDKTKNMGDIQDINLYNYKTKTVYVALESNAYNYKNTPINLVDNTELNVLVEYDASKISVSTSGQIVYITNVSKTNNQTEQITISTYLKINNAIYYKLAGPFSFTTDNTDENIQNTTFTCSIKTGIDSIKTTKYEYTTEPSESVEVDLSYVSYDASDDINISVTVNENGVEQTYALQADKTIVNGQLILFAVENSTSSVVAGTPSTTNVVYTFKFNPVNLIEVYNKYKNSTFIITFTSKNTEVSQQVVLTLMPESIKNVLALNYNIDDKDNAGLINSENEIIRQNANSNSINACINTYNYLELQVMTKFSEFDYAEIHIQTEFDGYLALLDYTTDASGNLTTATISNRSIYTQDATGIKLRVLKEYIENYYDGDALILPIVYSIKSEEALGKTIIISYEFYKYENELQFANQIYINLIEQNMVSIEVLDAIGNVTHNIARGQIYKMNVYCPNQYDKNDIVFEFLNQTGLIEIVEQSGEYWLKVNSGSTLTEVVNSTLKTYAQKTVGGKVFKSREGTYDLNLYNFVVHEENLFVNDMLSYRMLERVNVKDLITNQLQIDYNPIFTQRLVDEFKEEFKSTTKFIISYYNVERELNTSFEDINQSGFILEKDGTEFYITFKNTEEDKNIFFKVQYDLDLTKATPKFKEGTKEQIFNTDVYLNTTADKPAPISNYEELSQMRDGENYRLIKDINISIQDFEMLTVTPKSLDGNGYTIYISGGAKTFDLTVDPDFALFKEISADSIFKNIKIKISNTLHLTFNKLTNTAVSNISVLTANNYGIIYNCSVMSDALLSVNVIGNVSASESTYFSAITSNNNGSISNCQVICNMSVVGASFGGFVAQNNGQIASSYIKNSNLTNMTTTANQNIATGGFVYFNAGKIIMCYIEGSNENSTVYSSSSTLTKEIRTTTIIGGFAYKNSGSITDCYSNIPLVSSSDRAGFVAFEIGGTITRCMSLCKLVSDNTLSYGFVYSYDGNSVFADCIFIMEQGVINYETNTSNYNTNITATGKEYISKIPGVTPATLIDINPSTDNPKSKFKTLFKNYIYEKESLNTVWFYLEDGISSEITAESVEASAYATHDNKEQKFKAKRLQLASPNLLAFSQYELIVDSSTAVETGEYDYINSKSTGRLGSKYNPYTITSAQDFELYFKEKNTEYSYYRVLKDIDYVNEDIQNSKTYNKNIIGYIEGNGYSISNYAINSKESLQNGGLIATLGSITSSVSVAKNLNLKPTYINLPNGNNVGALFGRTDSAEVYNIDMQGENVVVAGKNVVGGIIGLANNTKLKNLTSDVSAKANHYSGLIIGSTLQIGVLEDEMFIKESETNTSNSSYAGSVAGYVLGINSEVNNVNIKEHSKAYAMVAGLVFGGVGTAVEVTNVHMQLDSYENKVIGLVYGGLFAGEVKGNLSDISIDSNIVHKNMFECYPIIPYAIGGIAGRAIDATLTGFTSTDGYAVIGANYDGGKIYNPYICKRVGGVFGYADYVRVSDVNICQNESDKGLIVLGANYVSGVIGYYPNRNTTVLNDVLNVARTKINFITEKTYTDETESEITEEFYFSYVSEIVSENIKYYTFNNEVKVHFIFEGPTITKNTTSNMFTEGVTNKFTINGGVEDKLKLYYYITGTVKKDKGPEWFDYLGNGWK